MKTRPVSLTSLTLAAALFASPALFAQEDAIAKEANAAFFAAVAHENAGNAEAAKLAYEKALDLNPKHAKARFRLGQLKVNYDKVVSRGQERKIGSVVIPEYKVDNAEFSDAIKALGILIEKASKDEVTPNFIIQDPSRTISSRKVSLQMKNVPSGQILNYLADMAKAKVRYDKHAVVITPH